MKLKTAIEYWDEMFECEFLSATGDAVSICDNMNKYIQFLKQPLQLGFFIPCDKDGKPLEKPVNYEWWKKRAINGTGEDGWRKDQVDSYLEYKQACDRVLFEGFELVGSIWLRSGQRAFGYADGKFMFRGQTIKTINDLSGKVDLVEKVAKQYKY